MHPNLAPGAFDLTINLKKNKIFPRHLIVVSSNLRYGKALFFFGWKSQEYYKRGHVWTCLTSIRRKSTSWRDAWWTRTSRGTTSRPRTPPDITTWVRQKQVENPFVVLSRDRPLITSAELFVLIFHIPDFGYFYLTSFMDGPWFITAISIKIPKLIRFLEVFDKNSSIALHCNYIQHLHVF